MTELISQARQSHAESFLFVLGSRPKMSVSGQWQELKDAPSLPSDWKVLKQVFLSNDQRSELETQGFLEGSLGLSDGSRAHFQFFQNESSSRFFIDFIDESFGLNESHVPLSLAEALTRPQGLVWLNGDRRSGIRALAALALQKANKEKQFSAAVLSSSQFPMIGEDRSSFVYLKYSEYFSKRHLVNDCDLLVYHEPDLAAFEDILNNVEQGRLVVLVQSQPSFIHGLHRFAAQFTQENRQSFQWRLAQAFEYSLSQVHAWNQQHEAVVAHEIMQANSQVRDLIEKGAWKEVELMQRRVVENSGIVTLNQSLLQNLIRRKIDIKTAFSLSRDPADLDQLLKKVGI